MVTFRSSRRLALGLAAAALLIGAATPVRAEDSGTVAVSLEVASPCLIVSPNVIDLGTLPILDLSGADAALTYVNCGVSSQRVYGRVTQALGFGGVTWAPAPFAFDPETQTTTWCPEVGVNRFAVILSRIRDTGREVLSLGLQDQELETVLPEAAGSYDRLGVVMPCPGSDGVGLTMSFTATFTASF